MPFLRLHPVAALAAAVTALTLAVHAWHAIGTACYVDFVTGVWLALAGDLSRGEFYRELIGPDGYGGTRYFPVFFTLIGATMRLGVPAVAAGFLVSLCSGALLVAGLRRVFARLALDPALAWALAVFVFAPRFAQQAMLAIRSDVLSAALVVWGLVFSLPLFEEDRSRRSHLFAAGVCFVLAAGTKVTSLYAPAAVMAALALAGRLRTSVTLGAVVALGAAAVFGITVAASGGRALDSWRACALAGVGVVEWLRSTPSVVMTQVVGPSRVFTAVLAAACAGWVVLLVQRGPALPLVLLPASLGSALVILASPGTSYTNQLVEPFAICVLLVGWAIARHPRAWRPAALALLILALGVARHSLLPVTDTPRRHHAQRMEAERSALVHELSALDGPVFSESPELPVMAGRRPQLLDPFALRVVTLTRQDVLLDVLGKLEGRRFAAVVLMYDPDSPGGRGWYTNMDLGWPIVSGILANYDLAAVKGGFRVYRPKAPAPVGSASSALD